LVKFSTRFKIIHVKKEGVTKFYGPVCWFLQAVGPNVFLEILTQTLLLHCVFYIGFYESANNTLTLFKWILPWCHCKRDWKLNYRVSRSIHHHNVSKALVNRADLSIKSRWSKENSSLSKVVRRVWRYQRANQNP
jgi:hypothetical protein